MNNTFRRLAVFAIVAAMQGCLVGLALAQTNPPPSTAGGQSRQYAAPGTAPSAVATTGSETASAAELPVLYVTSVEVLRTSTEPKLDIVRVTGLTSSQGWTAPQLVPTFWGKPFDDVLDLQFIATAPVQSQAAEGFVPTGAVFTLEEAHPFKGVRVRASENTPERMRTASGSWRWVTNLPCPGRRLSSQVWISASVSGMPGGQPSTTQPSAGPWLSPQVVTRNRWPKLLWLMARAF